MKKKKRVDEKGSREFCFETGIEENMCGPLKIYKRINT